MATYEVDDIRDKRIGRNGEEEYLIKWHGYARSTWEPASNILDEKLIANYENDDAKSPRAARRRVSARSRTPSKRTARSSISPASGKRNARLTSKSPAGKSPSRRRRTPARAASGRTPKSKIGESSTVESREESREKSDATPAAHRARVELQHTEHSRPLPRTFSNEHLSVSASDTSATLETDTALVSHRQRSSVSDKVPQADGFLEHAFGFVWAVALVQFAAFVNSNQRIIDGLSTTIPFISLSMVDLWVVLLLAAIALAVGSSLIRVWSRQSRAASSAKLADRYATDLCRVVHSIAILVGALASEIFQGERDRYCMNLLAVAAAYNLQELVLSFSSMSYYRMVVLSLDVVVCSVPMWAGVAVDLPRFLFASLLLRSLVELCTSFQRIYPRRSALNRAAYVLNGLLATGGNALLGVLVVLQNNPNLTHPKGQASSSENVNTPHNILAVASSQQPVRNPISSSVNEHFTSVNSNVGTQLVIILYLGLSVVFAFLDQGRKRSTVRSA